MDDRLEYWKSQWQTNKAFWHKTAVNKNLVEHIGRIEEKPHPARVFVPLCGKTLDMKWLYDSGHKVVGVDGSEQPILEFFAEQGLKYRKEVCDGVPCYVTDDENLRVYHCDLFEIDPNLLGKFDVIWDRGSLVAIYAEDRNRYAALIKKVFAPKCWYLVDTMVFDQGLFAGPPRSVPPDQIESLFGDACTTEILQVIDRNADPITPESPKVKWGLDVCHEIILLLSHKSE